jgi:hypothetical protein
VVESGYEKDNWWAICRPGAKAWTRNRKPPN